MKIDLTGRIAVVTGSTGQLGREMVRTLAECGADVAIHYHKDEAGAASLKDEVAALGVRSVIVQGDVTQIDDIIRLANDVTAALGPADVLVNNAVSQYKWKTILEQDLEDYENQFRACVIHNVLMAKAFIPAMMRQRRGRVIAVSTESVMQNLPGQSAYVAGKRGMDGLLRVLAKEVGPYQITVNQVAPGWTISDRDRQAGTEHNEAYEKNVPLRRRGTDQDVANIVAFLASDLANYITGSFIPVCGGNIMSAV